MFEEDGYTGEGALSYEAWLSAQFGLIEAVRELREKNPHIKFFVTARHEVLRTTHSLGVGDSLSALGVIPSVKVDMTARVGWERR